MGAVAGAAAYPKAKVEQKGLSLYGHVAQKEPAEVKSAVAKWLKQTKGSEFIDTVLLIQGCLGSLPNFLINAEQQGSRYHFAQFVMLRA